jgi:glyoxylase I family protein
VPQVVGLTPVRADEFRAGTAPFPTVRVSTDSIIDLMAKVAAPLLDHMVGVPGTAGNPVNHVRIAMSRDDVDALRKRLADSGVSVSKVMTNSFGARGLAPEAFYFAILTTTSSKRGSTSKPHSWWGERGADANHGLVGVFEHELGVEPKHPIAEARQHAVTPRIRGDTPNVVPAVHLEHHPLSGSSEVHDEAADDNLAAERNRCELRRG